MLTTLEGSVASRSVVDSIIESANRAVAEGDRALGRERYQSALFLLAGDPTAGSKAATVLRRVGRTYLDDGDLDTGLDCLAAALAVAEASRDDAQKAHTINVIAISHWQRGEFEAAEELYVEAGRLARAAGDDWLIAMVEQNLGVIANTQRNHDLALAHYTASLERYRALSLDSDTARVLNNIGMVHASAERWQDAENAYAEAWAASTRCGDTWARLMVEVNRTGLLIARRSFSQATASANRILKEASQISDTRLLAETYKHRGIIARETSELADAERYFQLAFEHAMVRQDLLLAAETAREQAELFLALERNREALHALGQAHRLFGQIRIPHELADVSRRLRRLEHRFEDVVRQWAQSIEAKDPYTAGHCERVADHACALAMDIGFDESVMFWFRVGALLHDVGKIAVPAEVLNKPGKLTREERFIIEGHAAAGSDLLANVEFPWDVLPMVRGHHERWDGRGYPDRLAGEQIPLAARVLCVADVYDALTTDRPYRPGFSQERALEIMSGDMGTAFDPDILQRFIRIAHQGGAAQAAAGDPPASSPYSPGLLPHQPARTSVQIQAVEWE